MRLCSARAGRRRIKAPVPYIEGDKMKNALWTCVLCCICVLAVACGDSYCDGAAVPDRAAGFETSVPSTGGGDANPTGTDGNSPVDGDETTPGDGESQSGCQTDDDCVDMLTGQVCRTATCDVASGICSVVVVPDGTPCGEEDMCKTAGACGQGFCIGQPVKCDDGNPCTDGSCKEGEGCVYFDNTASCDDADPCTANDICAGGKCGGTPVASCGESCGDGFCDEGEDCQNCAADCSPCSSGGCEAGEVENCEGGCSPSAQVGDGVCQEELDCATTGFDGGDCESTTPTGTCGVTEVEVCQGACVTAIAFAEMLTNDSCDEALNCGTFDFDTGQCVGGSECGASDFICADGVGCISATLLCDGDNDCADGSDEANCAEPGTCPEGKKLGCNGSCYSESWFGDGTCDELWLDCAETDWDGGDCAETSTGDDDDDTMTCDAGKVVVCEGSYCLPETWLGDGTCDAPMDCEATGWDGGDCAGTTGGGTGGDDDAISCSEGKQANCSGSYCYNSDWIGDGTCDSFFDCASTEFDGGDCL